MAHLCFGRYPLFIENPCDLCAAVPVKGEGKDAAHNLRFLLIHHNRIFYFRAFLIPKGNLSENIFPIGAFIFNRSFDLYGYIFAV